MYKFNILPKQLKNKFEKELPESINRVYLNSGLYSIEKEIETYIKAVDKDGNGKISIEEFMELMKSD